MFNATLFEKNKKNLYSFRHCFYCFFFCSVVAQFPHAEFCLVPKCISDLSPDKLLAMIM